MAAAAVCGLSVGCGSSAPIKSVSNPGTLVVSATSLSFGSVEVGQNSSATVSLSNPGQNPIEISKIQISGDSFSLTATAPITINGGYAYSLEVQFAPTAAGGASGSITLTTNGTPATVSITLSGKGIEEPIGPALTLQSTSLAFGEVLLDTPATQTVEATSSGTSPLTISAVTKTGKAFAVTGATFPVTLNPGQSVALDVTFDPTAVGAATGSVSLTSNATPAQATIALKGTGEAHTYQIDLSWEAPSGSKDPVAGYNIYREAEGDTFYILLNGAPVATTSYTDQGVAGATTYKYYVESVDSQGNTSAPSNTFTIAVPD